MTLKGDIYIGVREQADAFNAIRKERARRKRKTSEKGGIQQQRTVKSAGEPPPLASLNGRHF